MSASSSTCRSGTWPRAGIPERRPPRLGGDHRAWAGPVARAPSRDAVMFWVTATELEQWADRLDSQSTLPAVGRLAIHGSGVQVREVDFPAGGSVTYPGLDGYLVADGISPFVPAGISVWEVGTSGEVRDKA